MLLVASFASLSSKSSSSESEHRCRMSQSICYALMWYMTQSYVWHDSCLGVTWLIFSLTYVNIRGVRKEEEARRECTMYSLRSYNDMFCAKEAIAARSVVVFTCNTPHSTPATHPTLPLQHNTLYPWKTPHNKPRNTPLCRGTTGEIFDLSWKQVQGSVPQAEASGLFSRAWKILWLTYINKLASKASQPNSISNFSLSALLCCSTTHIRCNFVPEELPLSDPLELPDSSPPPQNMCLTKVPIFVTYTCVYVWHEYRVWEWLVSTTPTHVLHQGAL